MTLLFFVVDYADISVTNGIELSHPDSKPEKFIQVTLAVCAATCCSYFFRPMCKSLQFDFARKSCYILPVTTSTPGVEVTTNENMTYREVHKCGAMRYTEEFRPVSKADFGE